MEGSYLFSFRLKAIARAATFRIAAGKSSVLALGMRCATTSWTNLGMLAWASRAEALLKRSANCKLVSDSDNLTLVCPWGVHHRQARGDRY
jgi:hypothetical protein